MYTNVMLGQSAEAAEFTWDELSKAVDPLKAGKAVHIRRFELPPDHSMAAPRGGHPCDALTIDQHNIIRESQRT